MSRSKRSADLETRSKRLGLEAGTDHTETLSPGRYILYRRSAKGGDGTWRARWRDPETNKIVSHALGAADDISDANGIDILDWSQVQKAATKFFDACSHRARLLALGEPVGDHRYTVGNALDLYIAYAKRERLEMATLVARIDANIRPEFNDVEVAKLTVTRIESWLDAVSNSPRRLTGRGVSKVRDGWGETPPTEEQLRARRATANRNLAILKKALTLAAGKGFISRDYTPWRSVMPYKKAKGKRVRFLQPDEQRRLVQACTDEFRPMVQAALFTGSRYGPLCRMKVGHFDAHAKNVWIEKDKGDVSRYVDLSPEAVRWFKAFVKGRKADDVMFQRTGVVRVTRIGQEENWAPSDQGWQMEKACTAAGIKRLNFHELRHTYASGLVNAGMPLAFVAQQLGHADTRMVEEHYGHLCPSAVKESVEKLSPKLGIGKVRRKRTEEVAAKPEKKPQKKGK